MHLSQSSGNSTSGDVGSQDARIGISMRKHVISLCALTLLQDRPTPEQVLDHLEEDSEEEGAELPGPGAPPPAPGAGAGAVAAGGRGAAAAAEPPVEPDEDAEAALGVVPANDPDAVEEPPARRRRVAEADAEDEL